MTYQFPHQIPYQFLYRISNPISISFPIFLSHIRYQFPYIHITFLKHIKHITMNSPQTKSPCFDFTPPLEAPLGPQNKKNWDSKTFQPSQNVSQTSGKSAEKWVNVCMLMYVYVCCCILMLHSELGINNYINITIETPGLKRNSKTFRTKTCEETRSKNRVSSVSSMKV